MFSVLHIPLNVVWYLVYNEYCTWHTTSDDEQIIAIFHLGLQVYCSPSPKEHLHNPVMPLLARNIERRGSILCAHGGVCGRVGVCWWCVNIHCVCISTSVFRMVDTSRQHISVITQVQYTIYTLMDGCNYSTPEFKLEYLLK